MSLDEKNALVLISSTAIANQRRALASRGLGDLSKWIRPKALVLLVNDQRALLEEMERVLIAAGYEVRSIFGRDDVVDIANVFFAPPDATIHAGGLLSDAVPAKLFVPRFVMLGFDAPVTLGAELFALGRRISKLIHWGEVQDWEILEQRLEHYEFELLPRPIDTATILAQMTSWTAEAWTENGYVFDAREHYSAALECHEKALEVDPLCVAAWINKGYSLNETGRSLEAIECYDKAIKLNIGSRLPSTAHSEAAQRWNSFVKEGTILERQWTPWVRKGYVLLDRMGRPEEAIDCFDAALKLSADLISPREGKGQALDQLGRYQDAIACYEQILKMDLPHLTEYGRSSVYAWAWNLKGVVFSHERRFEDAIECYDTAISMDPDADAKCANHSLFYNKGIALRKAGRLEDAVHCYDKALQVWPEHAGSWHNKGCCFRDLGRMEEAIACHEKALVCEPPEVLAWHSKAQALEDLGRVNDAIVSYESYLSVAPVDAQHTKTREHAEARVRALKSRIDET